MIDYYVLLSRAVEGIPRSMTGARQALYERARKALLNELQDSATPGDLAAQRRSLEEAIIRLEAEVTKPSAQQRGESASVIQIVAQNPRADDEPANSNRTVGTATTQTASPPNDLERPTLSELLRIVDDAMKEPLQPLPPRKELAPLAPPGRATDQAAPSTLSGQTASRSSNIDASPSSSAGSIHTLVARAPWSLRERRQSAAAELRFPPQEEERSAPQKADLDKILRNLQVTSPGIEASALISKGGAMIASAMAPEMERTRVAGVTATLLKLGGRASVELARGEVQEVVVRADHGYAVMIGAGQGSLLLALATENSKLGYIFFGMQETIKALKNVM